VSVSTATVVVCGKCGMVSHLEGGVQPSMVAMARCAGTSSGQHAWKHVLVVVPWA
jgi:hypothetical protein